VTALPLPRARGQLPGISGSMSQRYEWDGMSAQNRFQGRGPAGPHRRSAAAEPR
jgi:hypothetical protein